MTTIIMTLVDRIFEKGLTEFELNNEVGEMEI